MNKFDNFFKKLPWITGFITALVWGSVYILFDKLHGMQAMFERQFPFLIAWLLGLHRETISILSGLFLAMLDALILGVLIGWLFRSLFTGKND